MREWFEFAAKAWNFEEKSDLSEEPTENCQKISFRVRIKCEQGFRGSSEFELSTSSTYPREILVSDFWARVRLKGAFAPKCIRISWYRELLRRSLQMDRSNHPRTKIKSHRTIPDLFRTRWFEKNRSRGLKTLLKWSDPRFKFINQQILLIFAIVDSGVFYPRRDNMERNELRMSCFVSTRHN